MAQKDLGNSCACWSRFLRLAEIAAPVSEVLNSRPLSEKKLDVEKSKFNDRCEACRIMSYSDVRYCNVFTMLLLKLVSRNKKY